ncbi:uncharacterized protein LOC119070508 [Bradysia coprophila]|uniref:uncharacterized protein LOC119070508 n=1 Tax=Bradysia coprophila TaxID=38358 RepID=UPI00187DA6B3|nr:uncharacterized protein LOC119070508 [Bradysia coprophila]
MKYLLNWSDMHIHPSSPNSSPISEENAATTIQANFRGYRVRKQLKDTSVSNAETVDGNVEKTKIEKDAKLKDEDKSATKIQAGVRGFLVRKKQKLATDAATKIQSTFRGFKTRKDLKNKLKEK